eukprot:7987320-Lingulodinium_polyedra.AAC.1
MSRQEDLQALAGVLVGGVPRGPLPPARSLRWWVCCRAISRAAPDLNPSHATPTLLRRLLHGDP